ESRMPRVSTHLRLPPIMLTNSPSTSRTTWSTVAGGSMERKRPAKRQAWLRLHSNSTAPFQSPARWMADVSRSALGNHGVPLWPTSRLSMVPKTDSTICASSLGWIPAFDPVGMLHLSTGHVHDGASDGLPFELLLDAEGRFGAAQQQPAASKQRAVDFFQDAPLGFGVEIDQDVAAEHQVERPQSPHALAQVDGLETDHPPQRIVQLPVHAGTAKVLHQVGRRQATVHLDLLVLAGSGAFQDLRGKVGAQDLDTPVAQLAALEEHGQAVRLLSGRCRGRPEPQPLRVPPLLLQPRQQDGSYGLIVGGIAKEIGLIGRHGLDHLAADSRIARGLEERAQVVDRA